MTKIVSSGFGPTKSSLTSPSFKLSSVSRTVNSYVKYLLVESQVAKPRPSVVNATLEEACFFIKKEVVLTLVNVLKKFLANFIFLSENILLLIIN